jgi:hypothetical protein
MSHWTFELRFAPEAAALTDMAIMQCDALESLIAGLGASMSITGWRSLGGEVGHRVDVRLWGSGELEIIARMDARSGDSDRFVRDVCICAKTLNCRLFGPVRIFVCEAH